MAFEFGIIEGLYDKTGLWDNHARRAYVDFASHYGFGFYIYAPKNDQHLREQWPQPWTEEAHTRLQKLSASFKSQGVRFGVGFTPFEITALNDENRAALRDKMAQINNLNPDILCILFDDFANAGGDLATRQAQIAHFLAQHTVAKQIIVVGTYYSHDPLLQRVYGAMPSNYHRDLGAALDPSVDIFWTGDHVISLGYDQYSLEQMAHQFQRLPFLWDNYPVNDTDWLKDRLRLNAFTNRPWQISQWCAGHASNPMMQPFLSMIPLATQAMLYQQRDHYDGYAALKTALFGLCGDELGQAIEQNLIHLTEEGLTHFTDFTRKRLITAFKAVGEAQAEPFKAELLHWLEPTA